MNTIFLLDTNLLCKNLIGHSKSFLPVTRYDTSEFSWLTLAGCSAVAILFLQLIILKTVSHKQNTFEVNQHYNIACWIV